MNKKLKSYIYEKFDSQSECAEALGWTRQKLNRIVLEQSMPSLEDTQSLARVLEKPIEEVASLFLTRKSRK